VIHADAPARQTTCHLFPTDAQLDRINHRGTEAQSLFAHEAHERTNPFTEAEEKNEKEAGALGKKMFGQKDGGA
jgi:hypothetical protein